MFEGLDDINWGEIDHINGSAAEVPLWIRDLAHNSDALLGIFDYGQTSGSIYESTAYIVPFVIDLLLIESVPDKSRIVEELSNVCWDFPVSYSSIREARNGLKIHDAFISKLSVLRDLARTGEGNVRVGIIDILSRFREFSSQLMPEFKALFESERSEAVQIALIEALSELASYTTLPQQHEFLRWFNQVVEDQEYSMAIRAEVAFAVLSLGTKWKWSTLEAEMSLIAIEVLASVLNDISDDNTVTLFPKYERAAKALAKLNLDLIIALFKSEYLGAQAIHFLVREALDQVFYRICHDKDWMFYDGSFAMRQRSFWYEIKELGMWIRRDYIPNHTLSAQFGESPQRRLLAVIVDIDCFWEIPTNLFSFFYGLPDTREELRALLTPPHKRLTYMVGKLAAVAIGGNSLILDPKHPEVTNQWEAVRVTCDHIANMIAEGWSVIITHGNGPQVGYILRRAELASQEVHPVPLDLIVADTQGSIGYMLQQSLDNALRRLGINRTVLTVVTQVRVDPNDSAFAHPSKPIGGFMTEEDARRYEAQGWQVVEDAGRGWRRVVASPKPLTIQEINAIRALIMNDYIVIAVGGGGIPVIRDQQGNLQGTYAVIDKDRASSLLAQMLRADLFVISTGVEQVALDFNKPQQRMLAQMTLAEAEQYIAEGHFAPGSMLPKIEAAVEFVRMGGPQAIITDPPNLARALRGETGTRIVPG